MQNTIINGYHASPRSLKRQRSYDVTSPHRYSLRDNLASALAGGGSVKFSCGVRLTYLETFPREEWLDVRLAYDATAGCTLLFPSWKKGHGAIFNMRYFVVSYRNVCDCCSSSLSIII